jgi:hypothetical protein
MSPPIFTPDGSEVSEIVLPDGSIASEVVAPDGSVVFEGPDIPDSAIHRWKLDDSSPFEDSIGSADATNNGTVQVAGSSYQGGAARDADGTNDWIDHTTLGSFGSSMGSGFAVGLTVETTATGSFGTINSNGNGENRLHFGNASEYSTSAGTIFFTIVDDSNNRLSLESQSSVDDGAKHRWLLNAVDPTNNSLEIWIDATDDSGAYTNEDAPSNFIDFNEVFASFAVNARGSLTQYIDAIGDDIIIYDSPLSSSEIQDDYDAQPWS